MPEIPHDRCPDSSLALLADPYGFIGKRCDRLGTDLFRTRLLLQENICLRGRDAAEMFYDDERFTRHNAVLGRIQKTLTGVGGVQGLDGEPHLHRKRMFTSIVTPEEAVRLAQMSADEWRAAAKSWSSHDSVTLYFEAREIICRCVCQWAGVPVTEEEYGQLTRELAAMFQYAGSVGPQYIWARFARRKRNAWSAKLVEDVRAGRLKPPPGSALEVIALHCDHRGKLLDPVVAGVELQNVLRPTVAVSVFITFAALALHLQPECREKIASGGDAYAEMFAQEVRRYFPFFPAVAGRVKQDFEWRGYHFPRGTRVILCLNATNRDRKSWNDPQDFRPERFERWNEDLFSFIPQGGGDREKHHRCPGDRFSVELIKVAARFLCNEIRYDVPKQNLQLEMTRLPPLPHSRFVIRNVRPVA